MLCSKMNIGACSKIKTAYSSGFPMMKNQKGRISTLVNSISAPIKAEKLHLLSAEDLDLSKRKGED